MLWTTYDAEPVVRDGSVDPSFVRTNLPTIEVQIIDFSKPFYSSDQGVKRIDSLVSEIKRLHEIRSDHVTQVLGVKRGKSPKGWERVIILVEKPRGVLLLRDWLPANGFDEEVAKVSLTWSRSADSRLTKAAILRSNHERTYGYPSSKWHSEM